MFAQGIEKELLHTMYKLMVLARRFEEYLNEAYSGGTLPGMAPHSSIGEEAIGVGGVLALHDRDYLIPSHRGCTHSIARGMSLQELMADCFGKATGLSKGKGHYPSCDPKHNNLGFSGIIGASYLIATGVAWSCKIRKSDQVVMDFFGDGMASQADFYPALNISAAWQLPHVFICENNLYSEETRLSTVTATKDIADLAKPFGIPGIVIDGNDVIAVYKTARKAVQRARKGKGPTLIECKTYRWQPHFEGCPDHRPPEEIARWKLQDPIAQFKRKLFEWHILTEEMVQDMETEIRSKIQNAASFAMESPDPDLTELYTDVIE